MDKSEIQKLIDSKSDRVVVEANSGKVYSDVWKQFLCVNVDGKSTEFVKCGKCHHVIKWRSRDGTRGLKAHVESCGPKAQRRTLFDMPGFSQKKETSVPPAAKSDIVKAVVTMCARDIRPFRFVEGDGFRLLADKLIGIGAKYGAVPAADILPSTSTVSRHLKDVVAAEKDKLIPRLTAIAMFGVTTDMWTHEKTNVAYITVTIQFIDSQWSISSLVLGTHSVEEKHTAECIRTNVKLVLEEFGAWRSNNVYVTDNASNMRAAFRDEQWLGCACHNLNLVLSHGLQKPKDESADDCGLPAEVFVLITSCKELVTLAKRTRMNQLLDKTLKQCVVTRWNSVLFMLKSVSESMTQLRALSIAPKANKNLLHLLAEINDTVLSEVIAVLEPFDAATNLLSTDKRPSIHLVVATRGRLEIQLTPTAGDSQLVSKLKQHLKAELGRYYTVSDLHCTSALLDPRQKTNRNIMTPDEREKALASLRQMVREAPAESPPEPANKRARLDTAACAATNFFGEMFAVDARITTATDNQVDEYLESPAAAGEILSFWQQKAEVWPQLSYVARNLLSIPAASTSSERSFSIAGRTVEERRCQLKGHTVDGLLFLHGLSN